MLKSIKTLKRCCKATLNVNFSIKNFDDDKKILCVWYFLVSKENSTT